MDEQRINALAHKLINGTINEQEMHELENWYNTFDSNHQDVATDPDQEAMSQRIFELIASRANLATQSKRRTISWPRIAAAASILLGIATGGYFLLHKQPASPQITKTQVQDIGPGGNKAILTLGNGKKIDLTVAKNGQIAVQGQVVVNKIQNGQLVYSGSNQPNGKIEYNTIFTPRGGQYHSVLPDGSQVWLNAASSITFPTSFTGKERKVEITGEAYFVVKHNAKMPFKVMAQHQTIEDIGTEFNINAYPDEPGIKTTLLEGSVRVVNDGKGVLLKPGQQSMLKGNMLSVADADSREAIAWKNGYLRCDGEKIESIMRKISRWYDVDIVYEGKIPDDSFYGVISRGKNISQALHMLDYSNSIHFKINGRRITVTK